MKAFEIQGEGGIDALALVDRPSPEPGPGQIKVKVHANSLNYRDLNTVRFPARMGLAFPRIPNSDGAGEVIAVGDGVRDFAVGDRVASCFFDDWAAGGVSPAGMASARGGAIDGMLAQEVVMRERGAVAIPEHLSYEEAATLPCAALTAWHALVVKGGLKAGETVLLLGTGGVSIFALQFAVMMGARPIVTSKSDEKLAGATKMGAWATINYEATPDWEKEVVGLTGGRGVDHIVEVGGGGTLERSIETVRVGGHIALIGVLTMGQINPMPILRKSIRLNGIYVGSREWFQAMNAAIEANALKPVIDKVFPFEEAPDAFRYMESAQHFGKIVVAFDG
jgi:NADPH:quinone reductase-like Zn-dependent oxidoreductase